jgi:putative endonuclease
MGDPRHDFGRDAEQLADRWLTDAGWQVLARRWRVPEGELDLVCLDPTGCLVGVEVRARRSARAGEPVESLGPRHVARLRAALSRYARDCSPAHRGIRIDLVSVMPTAARDAWRLRHLPAVDAQ